MESRLRIRQLFPLKKALILKAESTALWMAGGRAFRSVAADFEAGPQAAVSSIGKVTALCMRAISLEKSQLPW